MKLGKLVVIEGIDGSGKKSQWELLVRKMRAVGVDFPRYKQSSLGKLLAELLAGRHGDFQKLTPYLSTLPFVVDQYLWWRDEGRSLMEQGRVIVANRYVTSNIHQIYKLKGGGRNKFARWFWKLVYEELGLPQPDLVLFLDVSPQVARNRRRDKAEADREYQQAAYWGYREMCRKDKRWRLVKCMERNQLLTKEEINDRMMQILQDEKFV